MTNKLFFINLLIALSLLIQLLHLTIRAKKRGSLRPALYFIFYIMIAAVGLLFLGLSEVHILAPGFSFLGASLLIVFGLLYVVRGLRKRADMDEALMEINSSCFNPDRMFLERFGRRYFYIKSILVGFAFILGGIFSALRTLLMHS